MHPPATTALSTIGSALVLYASGSGFESQRADMNNCKKCGRSYIYDREKGHRKDTCNSCNAGSRRKNLKKKFIDYKGGKCQKCGYDKCIRALAFHHINPKEKKFTKRRFGKGPVGRGHRLESGWG